MTLYKWRRVSRNKIVARRFGNATFLQLTRYKSNRVQPKGTWKLRVLANSMHPNANHSVREILTAPLSATWPTEAVAMAQAYLISAQGLNEGPLVGLMPFEFEQPSESALLSIPKGGTSWEKRGNSTASPSP